MTTSMQDHMATAEAYYKAMNDKDSDGVASTLHPQVQLVGPLASLTGKEHVLEAAKRYMSFVREITVRTRFSSEKQVILTYDANFAEPIGICRTAVQMTFRDELIERIELFFDARPFTNS